MRAQRTQNNGRLEQMENVEKRRAVFMCFYESWFIVWNDPIQGEPLLPASLMHL